MVQRDQWDTYWGPKKIIFLIRDVGGPARVGRVDSEPRALGAGRVEENPHIYTSVQAGRGLVRAVRVRVGHPGQSPTLTLLAG